MIRSKKWRRHKIAILKTKSVDLTSDSTDAERRTTEYCEHFVNEFDNLDEMIKLTQEEINVKSPMSIKVIEYVVGNLSTKKTSDPDVFLPEFYSTVKEEIIQILHKIFQKTEDGRIFFKLLSPVLPLQKIQTVFKREKIIEL